MLLTLGAWRCSSCVCPELACVLPLPNKWLHSRGGCWTALPCPPTHPRLPPSQESGLGLHSGPRRTQPQSPLRREASEEELMASVLEDATQRPACLCSTLNPDRLATFF